MTKGQHLIGKIVGSCVLEKLLGYGGSSAVFLAQQQNPVRKVAIKVFLPRVPMDIRMQRDFYTRFLREAEAASKLDHPNILPIYSYGEQEGIPYIVMPYMEGGTLTDYMSRRGPLSPKEAQWYLEQIASALDYAHGRGFVHCDVKAANMLLDRQGHIMLSDFGIACFAPPAHALKSSEQKEQEAVMMGTPDYISPEQALGKPVDGRSDIYSLGVLLFYLLSKRLPFKAESTIALALMHIHERPPSLLSLRGDLRSDIDAVVQRALAKEPSERFQSAGQLYEAFAEAVVPATQEMLVPIRSWLSRGRNRPWDLLRATGMIGVLVLFVVGVLFSAGYVTLLWRDGGSLGSPISASINSSTVDLLGQRAHWPVSSTYFYDTQGYHILNRSPDHVALALYDEQPFSNFHLEVTMVSIKEAGGAFYGVVFRCAPDQSSFYLLEIGRGQYLFLRVEGSQVHYLASGRSADILTGAGKANTLAIEARGNAFAFYINGKPLGKTVVDTLKPVRKGGQVGLYVEDQDMEVSFSHLYVKELK